jgi:hypothetical protein
MSCSRCDDYWFYYYRLYDDIDEKRKEDKKYLKDNLLYCYYCYDTVFLKNVKYTTCELCHDYFKDEEINFKKYNNHYICNSCIYWFNDKITIKEETECPICYEVKDLIKSYQCDHYLCLNCFSKHYFATHKMKNTINLKEIFPSFPYDDFEKEKECQEWYDEYYDEVLDDTAKKNRPTYMDEPIYQEYERKRDAYDTIYEELYDIDYRNYIVEISCKCPLCNEVNKLLKIMHIKNKMFGN